MTTPTAWTEHEREVVRVVGDLLIPAGDGMPAASDVDVAGVGIDHIGAIREDLVLATKLFVQSLENSVPGTVEELRSAAGEHFSNVSELIASAYFLRPEVAKLIGYRHRIAIPLDDETERSAEFAQLTEPVVARGNVWRTTP